MATKIACFVLRCTGGLASLMALCQRIVHRPMLGNSGVQRLLWLMLFMLFAGAVEARNIFLSEVFRDYPEEITQISDCGTWKTGEGHGTYRVVVSDFLFGGSRLWIQWMTERDKDGRRHALHTLSPVELNDDHVEYLVEKVTCEETSEGIVIRFSAEDGHSGAVVSVELTVGESLGSHSLRGLATE